MARAGSRAWPVSAVRALACGLSLCLAAAVAPGAAQAQLLSDNEARKAILDLRTESRNKITQLESTLASQSEEIQGLRKSLLELNGQIELLRAELARSRGAQEQLARDLSEVQRQQRDVAAGVDERVRRLEPLKVTLDGREFLAEPQEKRQYEEAVARLRSGDFEAASQSLAAFVRRYPASGYHESAQFWLGNALYGKRDYREAIAAFRATARSADHPRTPEALLAIGNCQIEMKEPKAARATFTDLIKTHPESEAAKAAKDRLAALR